MVRKGDDLGQGPVFLSLSRRKKYWHINVTHLKSLQNLEEISMEFKLISV